ncbi:MAG: TIM barrel protein [Bacteroidota bacterium]|nr:TIM barrel protein [Bacteroidota bacterium]
MQKDDISLAAWALVEEFRQGKWKALDLPKITREDLDINGIEFVNTLFEVPTMTYLNQLKQNAADYGTELILIMVDEEGDGCAATAKERKQFVINHRKWIDIAHYLGCHAIRTNCRGIEISSGEEALKLSSETYHQLLDYAQDSGVEVLIENHGGYSNDPEWMVALMNEVNHPLFGAYPDWREPSAEFDNYRYLEKTIPFAKGMSYRNQPTEEQTAKLIALCRREGYHGWYGIESKGREAVMLGKSLLEKYLLKK